MEVYVCLDQAKKGKPFIRVRFQNDTHKKYPLTKQGCQTAGTDIFESGAESWMNSSSVDFPDEYGFKHDVRELMTEGFQAAFDKKDAPRRYLVAKMMKFCEQDAFQATLTASEKAAWKALKERIDK